MQTTCPWWGRRFRPPTALFLMLLSPGLRSEPQRGVHWAGRGFPQEHNCVRPNWGRKMRFMIEQLRGARGTAVQRGATLPLGRLGSKAKLVLRPVFWCVFYY